MLLLLMMVGVGNEDDEGKKEGGRGGLEDEGFMSMRFGCLVVRELFFLGRQVDPGRAGGLVSCCSLRFLGGGGGTGG